ncbi:hypothetical protein CMUS01_15330 [Colletotrichum musicola]|uniref:Celp0028 effector like protein n=1 Tax=Colletotrichum musicola TaxID=2175873 RepID=A0A8H6MMR6_9PEZI|nr:hypothetical protein CMUS01_15330 [Colletotrichum musicola]
MLSSNLLAAFLLSSVTALPSSRTYAPDDVIVILSDGSTGVMKAAEYDLLEAGTPVASPAASQNDTAASPISRRCEQSTEFQVISDEVLLGWDIAISPIAASIDGDATIAVSAGHSVSNTLSIGSSISTSFAEGILGMSMSIDYSQTWSTENSQSLSFAIPAGKYGVIISQPSIRRITGHVWSGCTDGPERKRTDFTSDSYENQNYGSMLWIKGVLRLCSSDKYPIPFCNGQGEHR